MNRREEEAKRFAENSNPHFEQLKECAEKVGVVIDVRSNPVTKSTSIVITGDKCPLLDGIRIPFRYDSYRLINAALQGQGWYNELVAQQQAKKEV